MSIPRFAIHFRVVANILFVLICSVGAYLYVRTPREMFPQFPLDMISVTTLYPGATPEQVERLVNVPLEDELTQIDGVDKVIAVAVEGRSALILSLQEGEDLPATLDDVRNALDRVRRDLPDDVEEPVAVERKAEIPVVTVGISGDAEELVLRRAARHVERLIQDLPGISRVRRVGYRDREYWVEADPLRMEEFGVHIDELSRALRAFDVELPGGRIEAPEGEWVVRTVEEYRTREDVENAVIRATPEGVTLRVGDVARVIDGFERRRVSPLVNGKPGIVLEVLKRTSGDSLWLADEVHALAERLGPEMPEGIEIQVLLDFSTEIRGRIDLMQKNAMIGLALVMISLSLFMDVRVALMAAMGLPVAVLGAISALVMLGHSINMMVLFAFILVIGMLVDDAIIVSENVYRYLETGMDPIRAAIRGSEEVFWPVVAAVTTTMAAFAPMYLVTGLMGKFMGIIPTVVILALSFSIIEAFTMLPSHLADFARPHSRPPGLAPGARAHDEDVSHYRWYSQLFDGFERLVRALVGHPFKSCLGFLLGAGVLLGLASTVLVFEPFPDVDFDRFLGSIRVDASYSLDDTERVGREVTRIWKEVGGSDLESVYLDIGRINRGPVGFEYGNNLINLAIDLNLPEQRERSTREIQDAALVRLKQIPGVKKVRFVNSGGPPTGDALSIRATGDVDLPTLRNAADYIRQVAAGIDAVRDLDDDLVEGKREVHVRVDRERAAALGLDPMRIGRWVQMAFDGLLVDTVRTSEEKIDVRLRLPETHGLHPSNLASLSIQSPDGRRIPLSSVATFTETRGLLAITRVDRNRSVTVTGGVDDRIARKGAVRRVLMERLADFSQRFPGMTLEYTGEEEETRESIQSLQKAFLLAIALIYVILSAQFRSYFAPFVVLMAVPFSILGVIVIFAIIGEPLSILSMIGIVALTGVVVNDSLVLLEFIRKRETHMDLEEAIVLGARTRLRPIILTSVTTIVGVLPMCFATSGQAAFLSPMARALAAGLTVSTISVLMVIPCVYRVTKALAPRREPDPEMRDDEDE